MSALQDVKKDQYQSMQFNEKHVTRSFKRVLRYVLETVYRCTALLYM